jgi:alkanesulfonate monooxygenase SsuD/methylene tetrahydromethanopterin reductase-like flavin-dependent oxidoreductase (luciferase family)
VQDLPGRISQEVGVSQGSFPESPIEFGIFDWIEAGERPAAEIFEHKLRLAEIADKGGIYALHVAEHQGTPLSIDNSPSILLSAAIQRTQRLRLGALTWVLTWYNPYRFYNEICALDQMSHGRIELGVGRGTSPLEAVYFDIASVDESRARYREALDIFRAFCESEVLNFEGQYYSYKDLELYLHPWQKPYPPLWFPSSDHGSIAFTATHGYNTVINTSPPPELRELYEHYREVWVEHKDDPGRHNSHVAAPKLGTSKHIFVAEADAEAERVCQQAHEEWQSHIGHLGRRMAALGYVAPPRVQADGSPRPANRGMARGFDDQVRGGFAIAGTPTTVADTLIDQIKTSTVNYVLLVPSFGNMQPELAEHSLQLICDQVLPRVRAGLGQQVVVGR